MKIEKVLWRSRKSIRIRYDSFRTIAQNSQTTLRLAARIGSKTVVNLQLQTIWLSNQTIMCSHQAQTKASQISIWIQLITVAKTMSKTALMINSKFTMLFCRRSKTVWLLLNATPFKTCKSKGKELLPKLKTVIHCLN